MIAFKQSQRGLSLVELMVALVLSMILMAGFLQIFLSVRSTYATSEAASRLQENGRFALDFLSEHARLAGYRDPKHIDRPMPIMPPENNGCSVASNFCSVDRGVIFSLTEGEETSDRISFEYQPPLDTNNERHDCADTGVTTHDNTIINTFTTMIKNGSPALVCRSITKDGTSLSSNVELVDGIDAIQFQYGIAPNGFVSQYVSADRVNNWGEVRALRIAVLANSVSRVSPAPAEKEYYLLDAGPYTFTDGKMRQVFTTTVYLRNSVQ